MRSYFLLVLAFLLSVAAPASATTGGSAFARTYMAAHTSSSAAYLPSYARQTGLACSACHIQFLQLTPFGRRFKLSGYTLATLPPITESDPTNGGSLSLSPTLPLSMMLNAGVTRTAKDLPDAQNEYVALPQELSAFLAGKITPKIGIFSQFTYSGADGAFGIDNIDVRYADHTTLGKSTEVAYGFTLNNRPGVQDLWNTMPAWGFPFIGSVGAPGGAASTMIDGALDQNVLGLGGYAMVGNLVYGELSMYRSSFQGAAMPSSATGAIRGVAPYWRLALQKEWGKQYLMVGTFGLRTSLYPGALSGPRDTYSDMGFDAQYESKLGKGNLVVRGTYIRERSTLDATFGGGGSANTKNTLNVTRVNASWYPTQRLGLTGGYFGTTGTTDAGLYTPNPVDGSANGDPKTSGLIGELDFNAWENTRIGLQYTKYSKFNGGSTNYDGSGRDASGNNTLYGFVWLAF